MKKHLLMAALFLGLSSLAVSAQVAPANPGSMDQNQNGVSTPGTPPTFPTDQQAPAPKPHDTDADQAAQPPADQTQQTPSATTPDAVGTLQDSQSTTGANSSQSPSDMSGKQSSAAGSEVQSQIQSALQQQNLSGVTVSVTDQSIDLSGTVQNKKDKQAARSIANNYANGRKVNDNVTISKDSSK